MTDPRSLREALTLLQAAAHTLRSYQYGNASGDLAASTADEIDRFLAR